MTSEQFDFLWRTVIYNQAVEVQNRFPDILFVESVKDDILDTYNETLAYCKKKYMVDKAKLVDRHKISAIMVISILKHEPIKYLNKQYYLNPSEWLFNESLAWTTGCSILTAFVLERIHKKYYKEYSSYSIDLLEKAFEKGIIMPRTYHGKYKNNVLFELHMTKKENNYNILALADKFFWLERNTFNIGLSKK